MYILDLDVAAAHNGRRLIILTIFFHLSPCLGFGLLPRLPCGCGLLPRSSILTPILLIGNFVGEHIKSIPGYVEGPISVADNHGHCLMASLFSDVFEEDRSPTSLPQATLYLLEGECNVPKIDVRRECRVVLLLLLCYRPMVLSSCMSFIILDMQIWTDV